MALDTGLEIRVMMADAVEVSVNQVTARLVEAIADATERTLSLAGKNFQNMSQIFKEISTNSARVARVNQQIADTMIEPVITAYERNVVSVRSAPPYQRANRYSGALLNALRSPTMAVGTPKGIAFIDVGLLDATARQWARLNFGAGPAKGRTGQFDRPLARIQFGSNQGVSLRLTNPPRPNFNVPQSGVGYFNGEGQLLLGNPKRGTDRSNITRVGGKPSIKGIAGRHFLDYGLVALGKNFGPFYRVHIQESAREALQKAAEGSIGA